MHDRALHPPPPRMCFQTADVVTHWRIRREVLLHALISFVYNTTILALALNLASGRLG